MLTNASDVGSGTAAGPGVPFVHAPPFDDVLEYWQTLPVKDRILKKSFPMSNFCPFDPVVAPKYVLIIHQLETLLALAAAS